MSDTVPIQHGPGCAQFRCVCGQMTTFCPNSQTYKPLVDLQRVGYKCDAGNCPHCGQRHWRGMTRVEK